MIAFSCSHCGVKFRVRTQFAGRASRCPTCKQPLVVPAPDRASPVAEGEIEGTSSSVARAEVDANVTLAPAAAHLPEQKLLRELLARRTKNGERYIVEREIARGGMGAVLRAVDCDIRREVAVKYMLDPTDPKKKSRFVEEAQITGQLEHPNIVPIHELGVDSHKRLFFSMKMVQGRSLAEVLDDLRQKPKSAEKQYSLGRLLNVFVNACHALAYAHSRGVVHRDLKPANIMLGDFGEVYVMDWGLAKVVASDPASGGRKPPEQALQAPALHSGGLRPPLAAAIATSRDGDADLTQEGAVLGTPAYMSPEQALGNLQAIDQRSDVYSLGAILYELLTLKAPIDKEGGYLAVLMRVAQGEIVPPPQREPQRAQLGKIPKELAAVAMKALAKDPRQRYPNVEALRHDIERFQEGRSVSAKTDTVREFAWKLFKRNRAVGLVTLVAVVFLAVIWGRGAWVSYREEKVRRDQERESVPAFVEAAHFAVERGKFDHALVHIRLAVRYDRDHAEARLLKGQLLMVLGDYETARPDLEHYLKLKPADAEAAQLLALCGTARKGDASSAAAIAEVLRKQNALALAMSMIQSREGLLVLYRERIDAAWGAGASAGLEMDKDGKCKWVPPPGYHDKVADLAPLRGMPFVSLSFYQCRHVKDLGPLRGMPLTRLSFNSCGQIKDLTPLQGMKLTYLDLRGSGPIKDLSPLQGMPLTNLDLTYCNQIKDLSLLRGMPLAELSLADCFQIKDLSPLRGMRLTSLSLHNCGQVDDLAPLKGMPLRTLAMTNCSRVRDLSLLKAMPLTTLDLSSCLLTDLNLLRGLALRVLILRDLPAVKDLTPLQGMPLTFLNLNGCKNVKDLTPLKGMKLTGLYFSNCPQVHDLAPLQGISLSYILLTPKDITKGMEVLRSMKSLRNVYTGTGPKEQFTAAEFWRKYDAGEFAK